MTAPFLARAYISLKETVNDPEGTTVRGALANLGFETDSVRSGKYFQIRLTANDAGAAKEAAERMCARLLANPVIETYRVEIEPLD